MTDFVGLLPAAGKGSRLGPIPCSKEIMPLGFQEQNGRWQPVTALEGHLRALQLAGAQRALVVISESKHDVVRYIGNGERYGLSMTYLFQQQLRGMPFALQLGTPWLGNAHVLFSMPDTLITPIDTMARLAAVHRQSAADVTLGLFPTDTPHKFGMVKLDSQGWVTGFVDKPAQTDLTLMWGLAAWSPRFQQLLGDFVATRPEGSGEAVLSDVFAAALEAGLSIQGWVCEGSIYHDIGTPEDFQAVVFDLATRTPLS